MQTPYIKPILAGVLNLEIIAFLQAMEHHHNHYNFRGNGPEICITDDNYHPGTFITGKLLSADVDENYGNELATFDIETKEGEEPVSVTATIGTGEQALNFFLPGMLSSITEAICELSEKLLDETWHRLAGTWNVKQVNKLAPLTGKAEIDEKERTIRFSCDQGGYAEYHNADNLITQAYELLNRYEEEAVVRMLWERENFDLPF